MVDINEGLMERTDLKENSYIVDFLFIAMETK